MAAPAADSLLASLDPEQCEAALVPDGPARLIRLPKSADFMAA